MTVSNQTKSALPIRFTDPERSGTYDLPGSSFDVASGSLDALLPAVLVSLDHMRTVLVDDANRSQGIVDNMTANDMRHAVLEFVRAGGSIDYETLFGLEVPD